MERVQLLGTDWGAVTAWATIALAGLTALLSAGAAVAIFQLGEAKKARYGQIVADIAQRWDSSTMTWSRAAADACRSTGQMQNTIKALREDHADKQPYYRFLTEPGFYEDMAILVSRGTIEYELIREWIGAGITVRYDKWKPAVTFLRDLPGGDDTYIQWEGLAERIRSDSLQSGGRPVMAPRFVVRLGRLYLTLGRDPKPPLPPPRQGEPGR